MRIQYTPTCLSLCVAAAQTHTHTQLLHATCVRVHPLFVTSTLRSLNPGHTSRRLWCVFFFCSMLYYNNLFHPSKRVGHGKKGPALEALLHLLLRLSSETGTTVQFNCSWKETRTKSLSYTTKQHCSLFSVTEGKGPFCSRRTQCPSIYPLPTDVDTVCCGLRCPLKTIVPLVSFLLLSFSSLSRRGPEVERRESGERPPDGSQRSGGSFCPERPLQWDSLWVAAGSQQGLYAGSIVFLDRPESLSRTRAKVSPPVGCSIPALPCLPLPLS